MKKPTLSTLNRLCLCLMWGSGLVFILSLGALQAYNFYLFSKTGKGFDQQTIHYIALFAILMASVSVVAGMIRGGFILPRLQAQIVAQNGSLDVMATGAAYRSVVFQMQLIGLLLGLTGACLRFDVSVSLIFFVAWCVLSLRYLFHPARRQIKLASFQLTAANRFWLAMSTQILMIFAMLFVLCCAMVVTRGLSNLFDNILLRAMLFCAVLGFYGKFRIRRLWLPTSLPKNILAD